MYFLKEVRLNKRDQFSVFYFESVQSIWDFQVPLKLPSLFSCISCVCSSIFNPNGWKVAQMNNKPKKPDLTKHHVLNTSQDLTDVVFYTAPAPARLPRVI